MLHILSITLFALLFFSGCFSAPKPVEHKKLSSYQNIKKECQQNPPQILQRECEEFLNDLKDENSLLDAMQEMKEDEKEESAYIVLADKESALTLKLQEDATHFAQKCQVETPAIIKNDDINSAAFCLLFDENAITLEQYKYLKRYAPRFDNNPQYKAYEEQYAKKMLLKGFNAMSKGDKRAALNAFKTASEANSAEASYFVGIIYEEKQIKKAIAWHKKALAEGVELSKVNLARLYLRIQLPQKAREYYLSAAKEDNALAQYRLFKMDAKAKSAKVRDDALRWLSRSAKNNYPQAQYIYGLQLMKEKREKEAQQWLEKATANGISDANLFLGTLYFDQKAYKKAYPLLTKAKNAGAADYMLAQMYENALGVNKNSVLAYRHYKRAHELAYGNYVSDMKRVQKTMTSKSRKAAQYIDKKESSRRKELAKSCGRPATLKNIKVPNRSVHMTGVAVIPLLKANTVIVYGEHEKIYYIIDAKMASKVKPFESVDIKAKAIGTAIVISSDTGALQSIYQFQNQKNCSLN